MAFIEMLEYYPDFTWNRIKDVATFLGALLAFGGVLIQMRHTAKQARKQREMELRKQVYFGASDSLAKMMSVITSSANMNIKPNLDTDVVSGLYKMHLVAGNPLIEKLIKCGRCYGDAIFDLMCDRMVIETLSAQAEYSINMHKTHLDYFKQLAQLYPEANRDDILKIDAIQKDLSVKLAKCIAHHDVFIKEKLQKELDLCMKVSSYAAEFNELMADCVVDIRRDLENKFNSKSKMRYKLVMSESISSYKESSVRFFNKVRSGVDNIQLPDL